MITDPEIEVEEPLISPELAAELGLEEGTDLVLSGKKKKKQKSDEPSEEVKALAKQLSKKAQKRIAQITQRKEKEAKRDDFLSTIHDHEISEEHRQLLTSTRDINQTQTMKQLLSSIYKKQAAGLTLTTEEAQLLYNTPNQSTTETDTRFQQPSVPSLDQKMDVVVDSTAMDVSVQPHDDSILSFDDIIPMNHAAVDSEKNKKNKKKSGNKASKADRAAAAEAEAEAQAQAEREKNNKNSKTSSTNVTEAASTHAASGVTENSSTITKTATNTAPASTEKLSLGSGLLAQLKKLKEGNTATVKAVPSYKSLANGVESSSGAVTTTTSNNNHAQECDGSNNSTSTTAYAVQATQLPVDSQGGIVKSVDSVSDKALNASANNSTSSKSAGVKATSGGALKKTKQVMQVQRSAEIQAARMELPVCQMEQEIIEAVTNSDNDTIILCGETGSGKSTQVPQFLYEAGFGIGGIIGITQPRRVAVTSTAERVSYEMTSGIVTEEKEKAGSGGSKKKSSKSKDPSTIATATATPRSGNLVGYQIRFDSSTVGVDTKIKFMTDGILLKEVAQDLLLRKYRVVILDEAHERNINTDVLLGMLSKVLPLRRAQAAIEQKKYDSLSPEEQENCTLPLQPLKLIIMSATMRVNDFQNPRLFPERLPPIIKVEARQYPVTVHFSKRTETVNYLKETHKKVCQIHKKLPEGGVLVFLSGKQEILYMCHKLAKSLNKKQRGTATVGVELNSDKNGDKSGDTSNSESVIDSSIDVAGLGASAEELMEQQEGSELTNLLNLTTTQQSAKNKQNKDSQQSNAKNSKSNSEGEYKRTMRDILNQDEIESDSDIEDGDVDSDDEDADSDGEGLAMDTSAEGTATEPSEEDIFILDGDENSKKRTKNGSSDLNNSTLVSRIHSSKSALVTGDSVRDQLLKEALGIDPTAIPATAMDTTTDSIDNTTTIANASAAAIDSTTTNAEDETEAVPELRAYILPLYALMPAAQQNRVFLPVPPGHRLIVVATNVAETSITIPGIRYVVDSGRQKEKVMTSVTKPADEDEHNLHGNNNNKNKRTFEGTEVKHKSEVDHGVSNSAGIAKYEVKWVSQAAASQRSGRAGRTGPGHCYRLYSANFYHEYLQPYQPPEITVTPLEELILQMKALGIDHIERFPFPTPPPQTSIRNAITLLTNLGAISAPGSNTNSDVVNGQDKNNKNSNDLSSQIAMATMNAMKSNSKLAHKQLQQLQELQKQHQLVRDLCPLTQLGKTLARFPINPRFAKMLVMAYKSVTTSGGMNSISRETYVLLSHALTLVATLAERSAFDGNTDTSNKKPRTLTSTTENSDADSCSEDEAGTILENPGSAKNGSILYYHEDGDALARLRATGAYIHTVLSYVRSVRTSKTESTSKNSKGISSSAMAINPTHLSKSDVVAANESSGVRTLCSAHRLHAPTLQRIVELREQLQDISASVLLPATNPNTSTNNSTTSSHTSTTTSTNTTISAKSLLDVPLAPPTAAQELALRQLLVSGFCDSIARRVPLGIIKTGPRRRRLCAYYSSHPSLQDIPLYIHPGSNLYKTDPTANLPEFVTYQNLVRNQRGDCIYMTCVSVVNPLWLSSVAADCPLLKWSEPLMSPAPYFDPHVDKVMCFVTPRFGVHSWDLPAMRRSLAECVHYSMHNNSNNNSSMESVGMPQGLRKENESYRWFAKLLLEGNVLTNTPSANVKTPTNSASALNKVPLATLKELKSALNKHKLQNGSASMIIELKHDVKINNLLSKLITREVCSVASLLAQLRGNPRFLLEEIQAFLISRDTKTGEDFKATWLKLAAHAMSV